MQGIPGERAHRDRDRDREAEPFARPRQNAVWR
jgi:hypothetical protein